MVELRQIIGKFQRSDGTIGRIAWDMDKLFYRGEFMATINRIPGAPVLLAFAKNPLSESQLNDIAEGIAKERGGVKPQWVRHPHPINGQVLDDEDEGDDTEDELNDE